MPVITLIRHGPPAYELTGSIRASDFDQIIHQYNSAGINGEPSAELKQLASRHQFIVCSNLLRSKESAYALGINKIDLTDSIFREVDMPYFDKGSLTLSVRNWSTLLRCLSVLGFAKNGESLSMAKSRARKAAQILIKHAAKHKSVLFVGHGFINYFIARELLLQNWLGPNKPGKKFWEYGEYRLQLD